jgi:hypothetical protein
MDIWQAVSMQLLAARLSTPVERRPYWRTSAQFSRHYQLHSLQQYFKQKITLIEHFIFLQIVRHIVMGSLTRWSKQLLFF